MATCEPAVMKCTRTRFEFGSHCSRKRIESGGVFEFLGHNWRFNWNFWAAIRHKHIENGRTNDGFVPIHTFRTVFTDVCWSVRERNDEVEGEVAERMRDHRASRCIQDLAGVAGVAVQPAWLTSFWIKLFVRSASTANRERLRSVNDWFERCACQSIHPIYEKVYTWPRVWGIGGSLYRPATALSFSYTPQKFSPIHSRSVLGQPINLPLSRVIGREIQYEK